MKIICIGRNYSDHIKELSNERPKEPVVFIKPDSSIIAKNQNFIIPAFSDEIHHEVELVVKINKVGKYIDESFSNKYYNQIGLGIDFTARDIQNKLKEKGHPWEKSKAFDNSCMVGDFINVEEIENISNINFELKKNSSIVQSGNSSNMMWKIDEIISYVSQYFTLKIGDLIFTGTPSGVSLNPETKIDLIIDLLDQIDLVLIMSVNPGFGGQKFMPEVLDKIKELKTIREQKKLDFDIEIDGGINFDNCKNAIDAGANILVSGTTVFESNDGDIKKNINLLKLK